MSDQSPTTDGSGATRRQVLTYAGVGATLMAAAPMATPAAAAEPLAVPTRAAGRRSWRAGDHHIHSEYSGGWDSSVSPPAFEKGGDAVYPIVTNAIMAKYFGLSWVMCTDHGGPNHSKVNVEQAYPDLLRSREMVPDVLQFWGMEFDAPQMDHHTLMIPHSSDEAQQLFELESRYAKRDAWPTDPSRDTEEKMVAFLKHADGMSRKPIVIAHHASRSATALGVWGQDTPGEFRNNQDAAPTVYIGFEGAPGHQAGPLVGGDRGAYGRYPTHGGYDQMTAVVGGLWDSLLGEGRKWWITATSDSHVHHTRGGIDFWPGEYCKTFVNATQDYSDVMEGLRNGRVFVTTGDLVEGIDFELGTPGDKAGVGETLRQRRAGRDIIVYITVHRRTTPNANGDMPQVNRIDLISGEITGPVSDREAATNPTTKVIARFGPGDWRERGDRLEIKYRVKDVDRDSYFRVRMTNTDEAEPEADGQESPWGDLWAYTNPIFVKMD